jgi:hypothetical protein
MRKLSFALAAGLTCAASPALAQDQAQLHDAAPAPPARYSFKRVDDGFVRLDTTTGHVAFCSPHSVGWACQAVPEDRAALEKEIARLQDENAGLKNDVTSLKNEVAVLREPPPPPPPPDLTLPADNSDDAAKMREDIAQARAAIENAWRRLVDMIVNFQKDMMHKG